MAQGSAAAQSACTSTRLRTGSRSVWRAMPRCLSSSTAPVRAAAPMPGLWSHVPPALDLSAECAAVGAPKCRLCVRSWKVSLYGLCRGLPHQAPAHDLARGFDARPLEAAPRIPSAPTSAPTFVRSVVLLRTRFRRWTLCTLKSSLCALPTHHQKPNIHHHHQQ
eukprot:SAG11_NODE_325_length_10712_cov_15.479883_3_plen_164_part_00